MSDNTAILQGKLEKQALAIAEAEEALKAATAYIEQTQPELDNFNVFKEEFLKKAHQACGVLRDRGIIQRHETGKLMDKLASDPLLVLDLVEKVAGMVQPDSFGGISDNVKSAGFDTNITDPFMKLSRFGDARAETRINSGLVE